MTSEAMMSDVGSEWSERPLQKSKLQLAPKERKHAQVREYSLIYPICVIFGNFHSGNCVRVFTHGMGDCTV